MERMGTTQDNNITHICAGLFAHVDAGKTTLSEALLYKGGVLSSLGRVDNQDAFLDTDEQERARGITIFSKQARMELYKDDGDRVMLTILDTPGHVDFSAEMERTLNVLDVAILVVSAVEGVQSHTKTLWKLFARHNLPVIIFVNKLDMPTADLTRVVGQLRESLSGEIITFADNGNLYEDIATGSEQLLEEYLENGSISDSSVNDAIFNRQIFPMLSGSALRCEGIDELLGMVANRVNPRYQTEGFGAYCFKITKDKDARLSHLRIWGDSLSIKDMLGQEKVNEIRILNGDDYSLVQSAAPGEIVSIPGLMDTYAGIVIGEKPEGISLGGPLMEPVLTYALRYSDNVDRTRMKKILAELEEELPELHVEVDDEHRELRVGLMGEVQKEVLTHILKARYDIDVTFDVGTITYKETINNIVEGIGHFEPLRHYAEVHLKLEPLEEGSGLQFDADVSEDLLDRNWQRLIRTHLEERIHRGVLTGSPITDMKITIIGGKAHNKHTEGGDFRQATYRAVRQGLMQASGKLLEPYYSFLLNIPEEYIGRAMTDIDRMCGTSVLESNEGGAAIISGTAPVATMHTYVNDVRAYTKGQGTLSLAAGGYRVCHNPEEVIADRGYNPDADLRNPSWSVFCSHGAGTNIPWNQVADYCHVPPCLGGTSDENDIEGVRPINYGAKNVGEIAIGTEEIDEIINRTAFANRKSEVRAHKGMSADRLKRRREAAAVAPKEVVYKGSVHKDRYLLVDGYNVIFAWEELAELAKVNIDGARDRLLDYMCNYQAIIGDEIIVVFDAYRVQNHAVSYSDYNNIHVVFTKTAQTADRYIEHFAHENSRRYDITVATSDGLEQIITRGAGCQIVSSRELEQLILSRSKEFNEKHSVK